MRNECRCKVVKGQGDFDRACDLGYGINYYGCEKDEMWLILPVDKGTMNFCLNKDNFEKIGEVLTSEEYDIQVRDQRFG